MYAVILAGGGGTRLWPLSLPERPKPFLPLLGDRSLLELTVGRLPPEIDPARDVYVVAEERYWDLVEGLVPRAKVLPEPRSRNTAAAVALAASAIERADDDVMLVLPADHRVDDVDAFRRALLGAERLAHGALGVPDPLITLGIRPTAPETSYGYIQPDPRGQVLPASDGAGPGITVYPVVAFEEKPDRARAEELLAIGGVAWNAGMFAWMRSSIRDAFARYSGSRRIWEPIATAVAMGQWEVLDNAYTTIDSTSVDRAVLQPASRDGFVLMTPLDVGWSDLGTWGSLLDAVGGQQGCTGRILAAGEQVEVEPDDVLVSAVEGRPIVRPGYRGRLIADEPVAVISGAELAAVQTLLDRVTATAEAR
ncbi:MAG TPA: sugar phosphate nucleotidyltransferase [Candidatus Limnocylindrales bacterium]|jgi:mannose-1-phosphate guanylyltransferase|nr:sugar phosphate nucleotidyltransferase [Candidatus Limnocylindrales bacterium]